MANKGLKYCVWLSSLLMVTLLFFPLTTKAQIVPKASDDRILAAAKARFSDPDESLQRLDGLYQEYLREGDSLRAVTVLVEQSRTYGNQAKYKDAYDRLWKALLLADTAKLDGAKAFVYVEIGRYYSFYKRREKAIDYFHRALEINRNRVKQGKAPPSILAGSYYAFAATYRELDEPELARLYLDSCWQFFDPEHSEIDRAYLDFERGFTEAQLGNHQAAEAIYREVINWMSKNDKGYQTLVFTYLGDVLRKMNRFTESEEAYQQALEVSRSTNSHIDFSPLVHEKLSDLYFMQGRYREAYESFHNYNVLDNRYFDSRSISNRPLLEIQDAFRQEMTNREEKAREERLALLERDREVQYLKFTVLGVSAFLLLIVSTLYVKYIRTKHHTEKALIRQERELEVEQANKIVGLKNKELAATTLKLIAKDEFIREIEERLSQIKSDSGKKEVDSVIRSIKSNVGNDQHWQEFEARFVAVNKDFYTKIKSRFPQLTQNDLRLCALIKLNFSSKDIAKLLGISVESVHTTRYRLRKKLDLERKDNLVEFIANV
ncbi:MAG: tetratricopeptide repeat protein [Bacteroidota bacterium]